MVGARSTDEGGAAAAFTSGAAFKEVFRCLGAVLIELLGGGRHLRRVLGFFCLSKTLAVVV